MKSYIPLLSALFVTPLLTLHVEAANRVFDVYGEIRSALANGHVVVAHDAISGLMPAMTMEFTVIDPSQAAALAVGDRVHFHLTLNETTSSAGDFTVISRGARPTAS